MSKLNIASKLRLKSGYDIPLLGFGVYRTTVEECESVVSHALKSGYRHIDSAAFYQNEAPCGRAISKSAIPRGEVFFTSKVPPGTGSYQEAKTSIETSLKESGLDYIDLILHHAPYGGSAVRKEIWRAMVEAQEEGKIRSLGVSNYGVHHLEELEKHIKELEQERGAGKGGIISVGQWELHPWLGHKDIVEWCQKRGVVVEAYCPLVRAQRMDEPVLQALAEKHGKTGAQVLVRWSLQKGFVPLPKSATPSRIEANAEVYDFELSAEDMKGLEIGVYEPCAAWDPTTSPLNQ